MIQKMPQFQKLDGKHQTRDLGCLSLVRKTVSTVMERGIEPAIPGLQVQRVSTTDPLHKCLIHSVKFIQPGELSLCLLNIVGWLIKSRTIMIMS